MLHNFRARFSIRGLSCGDEVLAAVFLATRVRLCIEMGLFRSKFMARSGQDHEVWRPVRVCVFTFRGWASAGDLYRNWPWTVNVGNVDGMGSSTSYERKNSFLKFIC